MVPETPEVGPRMHGPQTARFAKGSLPPGGRRGRRGRFWCDFGGPEVP